MSAVEAVPGESVAVGSPGTVPPPKTPATTGKLLRLAWPIVLARATQSVIGFSDAFMVAPLGEEPLAAVTTGALNTLAVIVLPMGTVFIVQSFAAQLRGRGETEALPRYAFYALLLALVAAVFGALAIPCVPWVIDRFAYAPGVRSLMSAYLSVRLLSVGAAVGIEALGNWYAGLGNTRLALVAGAVAMLANVALNYLLIEPRLGLPGYGVVGAAWASTLASWLGFGALVWAFRAGVGLDAHPRFLRLRWAEFVRVLRFGLPNGVNWFLEFAAFNLFINLVVAHLGTKVLAALNIVLQINSISFMPAFGVASAGAILVGEVIGRRAYDEVWPLVKRTGVVAVVWMVSIGLLYVSAPRTLMGLFRPRDLASAESLLAVGAPMLGLSAIWQLFDALGLTLGEALRAAGDTTWCMLARIVLAWAVFMPVGWIAVRVLAGGEVTVMICLIGYLALLALVLGLRFVSGRWKNIDLVGKEPELL